MTRWLIGLSAMKPAKTDYYDPGLKGRSDGRGMENLPPINPPASKPSRAAHRLGNEHSPALSTRQSMRQSTNQSTTQPVKQSMSQPTGQSTGQPVNPTTSPSEDRPTRRPYDTSPVLGRPKAFYITRKQDEDLDVAVSKLEKTVGQKVSQKIDRSTLIRLIIEGADLTNDQTISQLASRLVSRLISQLTG